MTTTTLAVGAAFLARKNAIVQKLTAIESLAGVDVLCSDKTGTLTANKLSLNEPFLVPGVDAGELETIMVAGEERQESMLMGTWPDWFMTIAVLASSHNIKS